MGPETLASPVAPRVLPGNAARRQYHEFQVDCAITDHRPDDPIVYFGQPGASHGHTFFGNRTVTASSTVDSLASGTTSCLAPDDLSGYWMPTLQAGSTVVDPAQAIVYYKAGVSDYRTVQPFPVGFRMLVGDPHASSPAALTEGYWSCGAERRKAEIPAGCSRAKGERVFARLQSPSCWDGVHLDSADHRSHVVYPIRSACPADHPVALPMLEFKIPYEIGGTSGPLRLSTGAGYTFHFDFVNHWDPATQAALVARCVNIGLQCDAHGFDQFHPEYAPVLDASYRLAR